MSFMKPGNNTGRFLYYKDATCTILHRTDGPAITDSDGSEEWRVEGELHREDGPARTFIDGSQEWWINGKKHRLDGPAIEWSGGEVSWYLFGSKTCKFKLALEQHLSGKDIYFIPYDVLKEIYEKSAD